MSASDPRQAPGALLKLRRSDASGEGGEAKYRLHRRFDRMGRLVGDAGMRRLLDAHVMLFGVGGVGSWAAEALARAGIGRLTIVDFDLVCVTNANRQLHALKGATGKTKVDVMAQRLRLIHPTAQIEGLASFYEAETSEELLARKPDLVIDAIDNISAKSHLIASCKARGIPLVVSGGASGRMDPTRICESDMTQVKGDPFLAAVRKMLRKHHDFPREGEWDIPCVHSLEPAADPLPLDYDAGKGFRCVCPQGENGKHTCDDRNLIYGTAGFVTGAFGLACSAAAVRMLLSTPTPADG
jgi:tRNA A37 threonylcarbamoyladenosine dehydratase